MSITSAGMTGRHARQGRFEGFVRGAFTEARLDIGGALKRPLR